MVWETLLPVLCMMCIVLVIIYFSFCFIGTLISSGMNINYHHKQMKLPVPVCIA